MNHPHLFFRGRIDMNNRFGIGFILTMLKQNWKFLSRSTTSTYIFKPHRITPSPIYNTKNREDNPDTTTEVRSPDTPTLPDSMTYSLPHRHNRGVPPNRYSPETEGRKSKYLIANFISAHNMSDAAKVFIEKVSSE
jgi:hypothetical protein